MTWFDDGITPAPVLLDTAKTRREVRGLLDEARAASQKKHHLVPASYLRNWARNGKVGVVDLATRHSYVAAPEKVARHTDFYRLDSDDVDPDEIPPLLMEVLLSKIEGAAVQPIAKLIDQADEDFTTDDRASVAMFVAFQLTRGRAFRSRIQQSVSDMYRLIRRGADAAALLTERGIDATPEAVDETESFLRDLQDGSVTVEQQPAALVSMIGEMATALVPHIFNRRWGIWSAPNEIITTDEPVLALGGRNTARGQVGGTESADVVLFPLAPRHLLVMFRPMFGPADPNGSLTSVETLRVNLELLAHAERWQFSQPDRGVWLPTIPPPVPASIQEDDIEIADGEDATSMVHSFTPNRWLYAGDVPWPVEGWWRRPDGSIAKPELPSPWMSGRTVHVGVTQRRLPPTKSAASHPYRSMKPTPAIRLLPIARPGKPFIARRPPAYLRRSCGLRTAPGRHPEQF